MAARKSKSVAKAASPLSAAKIVPSDSAPLYGQIRSAIHSMITRGDYPHGATLPGEKELSEHFNVSRITVKRAMNDLALAGLVRRMRGRGTIVTYGAAHPVVRGSFSTLIDSLKTMGLETEVVLLSVEDTPADAAIADLLGVRKGVKVQRAVRLRRLEGRPFSYLVTYVPLDIARNYSREDLAKTPLLTLLERAGARAIEAEQTLTAIAAPPDIANHLQMTPGAPLLHITRVMRDEADRAVQVIEANYRPDLFQYHMRLSRRRAGSEDVWSDAS
ncbi:MAG: GntR family transcriptional regulator [Parvularculaceae bacterium]